MAFGVADVALRVQAGEAQSGRRRARRSREAEESSQDRSANCHGPARSSANEAWTAGDWVVEHARAALPFRPSARWNNQVKHCEVDALGALRKEIGIPLMLDESLCGYPDAELAAIAARGTADLFNVRLSKCGGLIPSLRIIGLAQRSGLRVQLGCHPGETALLSAAGRHLASHVSPRDQLRRRVIRPSHPRGEPHQG